MNPWFNQVDFKEAIGNLPPTFEGYEKLTPILRQIGDTWFSDLVGPDRVGEITALVQRHVGGDTTLTEDETALVVTSAKFLGYAVWSQYTKHANVSVTNTGLVTKNTGQSEPISFEQRQQLSRDAKALAEHYALKLRRLIEVRSCDPSAGNGGGSSFRTVKSRRRSRFD